MYKVLRSKMLNPSGKVVFITSVDSGYGQSLACTLARMDVTVLAGCADPASDVLRGLRDLGVYLIRFEPGNENAITEGMMRLTLRLATWNRDIDAVVINSGADAFGDFEWTSVDYIKQIIEINCLQVARYD